MSKIQPRHLILTRHAKSGWDDPVVGDHERALTARGQRAARALGTWLAAQECCPDQILCSTAARAVATWRGIAQPCGDGGDLRLLPGLYHAGPEALLAEVQKASGACVLVVAHNPGIAMLARWLAKTAPDHARFDDFPTGATLVLEFGEGGWATLRPGTGRVCSFVVPRDLT